MTSGRLLMMLIMNGGSYMSLIDWIVILVVFAMLCAFGGVYDSLHLEDKRLAQEIRRLEDKLDVLRCKVRDDRYGNQ